MVRPYYGFIMKNANKPNFETLKEGDKLRDTKTGEVFSVCDIDRDGGSEAIHTMRIAGGKYAPVQITPAQWARLEVIS